MNLVLKGACGELACARVTMLEHVLVAREGRA